MMMKKKKEKGTRSFSADHATDVLSESLMDHTHRSNQP